MHTFEPGYPTSWEELLAPLNNRWVLKSEASFDKQKIGGRMLQCAQLPGDEVTNLRS